MTRTICFDAAEALRDRRFRRKLTKYEGMDFVFLLGFAGSECRDPAFIPAKKMEDLALDLGWTGKAGEEQKRKRLAKWSAPGIELIELQADGGIQINYLLDRELDEEEGGPVPSYAAANGSRNGNSSNGSGSGSAEQRSNGTDSSNSAESRHGGDRRQKGRRYSETPEAERSRRSYREKKMREAGIVSGEDLKALTGDFRGEDLKGEDLKGEDFKNLTPEAKNLTPSTSKPHALAAENSAEIAVISGSLREVSPACVGDVKNVVGDLKNSYTSDNVSNVPADKNLTQNLTAQNLTPAAKNLTAQNSVVGNGKPAAPASDRKPASPPPRPVIRADEVHVVRQIDVSAVLRATGDNPAEWKAQWVALWNHCYSHGQLRCWDEGIAYLAWRLKVSPGSGPGSIKKAGPLTRGTILPLLAKAGAPYVPVAKGEALAAGSAGSSQAADLYEPADLEEQAQAHREIMELKAIWDAEIAEGAFGTTPLQESLAASMPPSYTPLDETYQDASEFPEPAYREDLE